MQRRQFLSSTALLVTASLAGCALRDTNHPSATAPDSVTNWTFNERVSSEDVEAKPTIECSPDEKRVRITGRMYSGDTCTELGVKSIELDDGEFRVEVSTFVVESGSCGQVMEKSGYEATFSFTSSLPEAVIAIESVSDEPEHDTRREKSCSTGR